MKKQATSSFEILSDMVYVVNKNKVKNIRIIGNPDKNTKKTKFEILYEGLHNGNFKSDGDAAKILGYSSEKEGAYVKLKHELKKRLINTLLHIDTEQAFFTDLEKARYNARRNWTAISYLWARGARKSAISLAEELFPILEKYEITDVALDMAKKLTSHYALEGDKKKHRFYYEAVTKFTRCLNAETLAEQFYSDIIILSALNKSHKPELYDISENALNQLEAYKDVDSIVFIIFRGIIERCKYDGAKDFRQIIEVCKKNIEDIKAKPFFHKHPIIANLHNMAASHIMLRQFDAAQNVVDECLTYLEEGATNWFKSIEIYIALCFHTNRFQKAHELYVNGSTQRNFKNLVPGDRERWTLYSGYLDLFIAMELLTVDKNEQRALKISRIVADMPEAQKDKRGMNIPLLILDIMMRMQQGEHNNPKKVDNLFARIENLSYYRSRYLKKENDTFRSDVFIALIQLLEKHAFNFKKIQPEAANLYARFQEKPYELNQPYDVEVINYEKTWLHICNYLKGIYKGVDV